MNDAPNRPLTPRQQMDLVVAALEIPALSVLPLLRRRIGLRTLKLPKLGLVLLALLLGGCPLHYDAFHTSQPVPHYDVTHGTGGQPPTATFTGDRVRFAVSADNNAPAGLGYVGLFAFAAMISAAIQTKARWKEFKNGTLREHPDYWGDSVFARRLRMKPENADFGVCILAGLVIGMTVSSTLGFWLVLSGCCLRFVLAHAEEQQTEQQLAAVAAARESDALAAFMQRFEQPRGPGRVIVQEAVIVRTSMSADVETLISRRQSKTSPPSGPQRNLKHRLLRFLIGRHLHDFLMKRHKP